MFVFPDKYRPHHPDAPTAKPALTSATPRPTTGIKHCRIVVLGLQKTHSSVVCSKEKGE